MTLDPTAPLPITEARKPADNRKPNGQFGPGNNANPKGRPHKDWSWAGQLQEAVEEAMKDGKPLKYHMARAMVKEVLKGNVQAFNAIMNRMDGMPEQATDITSKGEKIQPMVIMDTKKPNE